MSEMLQLNEQHRRAYVNAADLQDVRRKLDDELTLLEYRAENQYMS